MEMDFRTRKMLTSVSLKHKQTCLSFSKKKKKKKKKKKSLPSFSTYFNVGEYLVKAVFLLQSTISVTHVNHFVNQRNPYPPWLGAV